jgi:magnesium chelatase family protein
MLRSIAGEIVEGRLSRVRQFKEPHHSASTPALVGGGRRAGPGEISLAHNGVLFLDELAEFDRRVLDSLRQPLETGEMVVSRANAHVRYPSRVQLVAAMNPCRCGNLAIPGRACSRAPKCAIDYQSRISGPLLDRIDLLVETPAIPATELARLPAGESSAQVASRVARAREVQRERYATMGLPIRLNAQAEGEALEAAARMDADARDLLARAAEKLGLSARGMSRVLRIARTLADLLDLDAVGRAQIAEAAGYRRAALAA